MEIAELERWRFFVRFNTISKDSTISISQHFNDKLFHADFLLTVLRMEFGFRFSIGLLFTNPVISSGIIWMALKALFKVSKLPSYIHRILCKIPADTYIIPKLTHTIKMSFVCNLNEWLFWHLKRTYVLFWRFIRWGWFRIQEFWSVK